MSRYRKIDPRIWNDSKFRALSDQGKLVFLFLLTHPHMTAIGAMRASIPGLAAEIGWTQKAFAEAFEEASCKGMSEHDAKACFVWLPNFVKYNQPESPNVVKAWEKSLDLLPECPGLTRAIAASVAFTKAMNKCFAEALPEAFTKALSKGMPYQEQEQEQKQNKDKGAEAPPSFDPVSISGLNPEAWTLWLEHRKAIKKPIRPHSMRDAAEELAKLGNAQLAEVKRARAGGWQGIHPEKQPALKQSAALATLTHEQRERDELVALINRRDGIGLADFRMPLEGERSAHYRAAQDDEWSKRKSSAPHPNVASLLGESLKRISPT